MTVTAERPVRSALPPLGHVQTDLPSADFSAEPFVLDEDGWRVYLDASLDVWAVYVDAAHHRTFVHPEFWSILLWGPAKQQFIDDFLWREVGGMRFVVRDAGTYGEAARREAKRLGTDVPLAKDRMLAMVERANGLIIQAVSLNDAPTVGQQQAFALRYAQLREDFAGMEQEMSKIRALIDLAGAALVHASAT